MNEGAARTPIRRGPQTLRSALVWAIASIYLPIAAAFFFGPVAGHTHCEGVYAQVFPIIPGLSLGALSHFNSNRLWIGGIASLVILAAVLLLFRGRSLRTARILAVVVALFSLLNALAISAAIRA